MEKFCLYILFYIDFITVILHAAEIRTANLEEIIKLYNSEISKIDILKNYERTWTDFNDIETISE